MARRPCLKPGQPVAPQREALAKGRNRQGAPAANSGLKEPAPKRNKTGDGRKFVEFFWSGGPRARSAGFYIAHGYRVHPYEFIPPSHPRRTGIGRYRVQPPSGYPVRADIRTPPPRFRAQRASHASPLARDGRGHPRRHDREPPSRLRTLRPRAAPLRPTARPSTRRQSCRMSARRRWRGRSNVCRDAACGFSQDALLVARKHAAFLD